MIRKIFVAGGWLCVIAIVIVTLNSANARPHFFLYPSLDRLFAFAMGSFLMGVAYPRQLPIVLLGFVVAAIGLEALQYLRPTRDPRFFDAVVKVLGSAIGVTTAKIVDIVIDGRAGRNNMIP